METKKIIKFRQKVKENSKLLVEKGFKYPTVRSYIYTKRLPSLPQAKKLAKVLKISLKSIPYYHVQRG